MICRGDFLGVGERGTGKFSGSRLGFVGGECRWWEHNGPRLVRGVVEVGRGSLVTKEDREFVW